MLVPLLGTSCWALASVACAMDGSGWPIFDGNSAAEILAEGFGPFAVSLVVALLLWAIVGPPFRRQRGE